MSITFKELVSFYRNPSFEFDEKNSNSASFVPKNEDDLALVHKIIAANEETGLVPSNLSNSITIGTKIIFEQILPRTGFGRLFVSFSELIKKNPQTEPKNYYIKSLDYCSSDETEPTQIQSYKKLISFIHFFKSISTYYDDALNKIIFVTEGTAYKIDAETLQISETGLEKIDFDSIDQIQSALINDDSYKENRKRIFIETLGSLVAEDHINNSNLNFVIQNIGAIAKEFDKRLKVFLANFSYDKIVNQLRVMQVEETGKIHKVFSDIQNQALALPIASLLAISQMKDRSDNTINLITNSFIIAGVVIFIFIVWLLLRNQKLTLGTLATELKNRKEKILHDPKYAVLSDDSKITEVFDDLNKRKTNQKRILGFITKISWLCLVASCVYYFYLNFPETWNLLCDYISSLFDHISSLFAHAGSIDPVNEQQ